MITDWIERASHPRIHSTNRRDVVHAFMYGLGLVELHVATYAARILFVQLMLT